MIDAGGDGTRAIVSVWRIATDTPQYEAHDLSGQGAERSGGRWNRPGTPLVYASSSRALACLETVVHLGAQRLPLNRYLVRIDVPRALWEAAVVLDLPSHVGWDALPAGRVSLDWGDGWCRRGASLIARVPSIVVPEEDNVLINPRHPQLAALTTTKLRRWTYDSRLAG